MDNNVNMMVDNLNVHEGSDVVTYKIIKVFFGNDVRRIMKFNPDMVKAIENGTKSQTRRKMKPNREPYQEGDILSVNGTDLTLIVSYVGSEQLNEISPYDAKREGVPNQGGDVVSQFQAIWENIYGVGSFDDSIVDVIKFEVKV